MGYIEDFYRFNLGVRKRYWLKEFLTPRNYSSVIKYRHQRAERGWSDRDTWGGGEHIAMVTAGILHYLEREQNPIDWDEYFRTNYPNNYGYSSLTEVADDIDLYLWWEVEQWSDEYDSLSHDDRLAITIQIYSQLENAMHFVAANILHLWW